MTNKTTVFCCIFLLFFSSIPLQGSSYQASTVSHSILSSNTISLSNGSIISNETISLSISTNPGTNTTFQNGSYVVQGVVNSTGSFQNNSVLTFTSLLSGWAQFTYTGFFSDGSNASNEVEFYFDNTAPSVSLQAWKNSTTLSNGSALGGVSPTFLISCSDNMSTISSLGYSINGGAQSNFSSSSSLLTLGSYSNNSLLTITCQDFFGNTYQFNTTLLSDSVVPSNNISFTSSINVNCVPSNWQLMFSASDNYGIATKYVQLEGFNPSIFIGPFSPPSNFSGNMTFTSTDLVNLSTSSVLSFPGFDLLKPNASISTLSNSTYFSNYSDNCQNPLTAYQRFGFSNGSTSPWSLITSNYTPFPTVPPSVLHRLELLVIDASNFSTQVYSSYSSSNSSSPASLSFTPPNTYSGSFVNSEFNFATYNPLNVNYSLEYKLDSGSTNSSSLNLTNYTLSLNLSHGTVIQLWVNASNHTNFFQFVVDSSVSTVPSLSISGNSVNVSNTLRIASTATISLSNLSDDSNGVGYMNTECNQGTGWSTVSGTSFSPASSADSETAFAIQCRIVDLLGNRGPSQWINGTVDTLGPTIAVNPSNSAVVSLGSPMNFTLSDNSGIGSTQAQWVWSNGTSLRYHNVSGGSSSWSGSPSTLFQSLGDGTLSLTVISSDSLGNQKTFNGYSWTVNTTLPLASHSVSGTVVNGYINANNVSLFVSPPSGTHLNAWVNWTWSSTTGTLSSGNTTTTLTVSVSNASEVRHWLNVTVGDSYGRTVSQSWSYVVDSSVSTVPSLSISGVTYNHLGTLYVGPNATVQFSNITDDGNGVGIGALKCSEGGGEYFTIVNSSYSGYSAQNTEEEIELRCRLVDQLGNLGDLTFLNYTIDSIEPQASVTLYSGSAISKYTSLELNASDNVAVDRLELEWGLTNGSTMLWSNYTTTTTNLTVSANSLFPGQNSGNLSLNIIVVDKLGNMKELGQIEWLIRASPGTGTYQILGANVSTAQNGIIYAGSSVKVRYQLSEINFANYTINTTVYRNGSQISSAIQNTSTVVLNLSSMGEGSYVVSTMLCGELICVNSTKSVRIDLTSASPQSWLTSGSVKFSGQTILVGKTGSLSIQLPAQVGVQTAYVSCWNNSSTIQYNSTGTTFWQPNSNPSLHNISTMVLSCHSVDLVNNTSPVVNYTMMFDFVLPELNASVENLGGYVYGESIVQLNCEDLSSVAELKIAYALGNSSVVNSTSTSNMTINLAALFQTTQNQLVTLNLSCEDSFGNRNTTELNYDYYGKIPSPQMIFQSTINKTSFEVMGNASSIAVSNFSHLRGKIQIKIENATTTLYQTQMNVTNSSIEIMTIQLRAQLANQSNSPLSMSIRHYTAGNLSASSWERAQIMFKPNTIGLSDANKTMVANGSTFSHSLQLSECNTASIAVSGDLTMNQSNVMAGTIQFNVPLAADSWLNYTISVTDCIGNAHQQVFSLAYDLTPIQINFTLGLNQKIGPSSLMILNLTDNSGLETTSVAISMMNTTKISICGSVVSSCSYNLSQYGTLMHGDVVYIFGSVWSKSGEYLVFNYSREVDAQVEILALQPSGSENLSNGFISTHTRLNFTSTEVLDRVCVGSVILSFSQQCETGVSWIKWSASNSYTQGNITVYVDATDRYGNTRNQTFNFTNLQNQLNQTTNLIEIPSPQWVSLGLNGDVVTTTYWEDSGVNLSSTNGSIYISDVGSRVLSLRLENAVGFTLIKNISVVLDLTEPTLVLNSTGYFVGRNSTFGFGAADNTSHLKTLTLNFSSTNISCNLVESLQGNNYNYSRTFSAILGGTNCSQMLYQNLQVQVNLSLSNSVGRTVYSSNLNYQFIGTIETEQVYVDVDFGKLLSGNTIAASPYTNLTCMANHLTNTTLSISVSSGAFSSRSNTSVGWNSGNGTVHCQAVDGFGNQLNKSFTVQFLSNDINLSISVLNGMGNMSRAGSMNLNISANSSVEISSLRYTVENSTFSINNLSSDVVVSTTPGIYHVLINATNELGYVRTNTLNITIDGVRPSMSLLNSNSTNAFVLNSSIFVRQYPYILAGIISDDVCVRGTELTVNRSGNFSWQGDQFEREILNPGEIAFSLIDCVGNSRSFTYNIINKTSIQNPLIQYSNVGLLSPTNFTSYGISTAQIDFMDALNLSVNCSASTATIDCSQISTNSFAVIFNTTANFSTASLIFSDSIGNQYVINYNVYLDRSGPQCDLQSHKRGTSTIISNLNNVVITCTDLSPLSSEVLVSNGISNSSYFGSNGSTILGFSVDGNWTITATDVHGNSWTKVFNLVEDQGPPVVFCKDVFTNRSLSSLDFDYILKNPRIQCTLSDESYVESKLEIMTTSGSSYELNISLPQFNYTIPVSTDGVRIWFNLTSVDFFGRTSILSSTFVIDGSKPVPMHHLEPLPGFGPILLNDVFIPQSSLYVNTTNDNSAGPFWTNISFQCSGNGVLFEDSTSLPSYAVQLDWLNNVSCPDSNGSEIIELRIDTVDSAGNSNQLVESFRIDRTEPEVWLGLVCGSNLLTQFMPLDHISASTNCKLVPEVDDDTEVVAIYLQYSSEWIELDESSFDVSIISSTGATQFNLLVIDGASRSINYTYHLFVDDKPDFELTGETCNLAHVLCSFEMNNSIPMSITIHSPLTLEWFRTSYYNSSNVTVSLTLDLFDSSQRVWDSPASSNVVIPIDTVSGLNSGVYLLRFHVSDAWGRQYIQTTELVIEFENITYTILSGDVQPFLTCITCNVIMDIDYPILVDSISTNGAEFEILEFNANSVRLLVNLNPNNLTSGENSRLELAFLSRSNVPKAISFNLSIYQNEVYTFSYLSAGDTQTSTCIITPRENYTAVICPASSNSMAGELFITPQHRKMRNFSLLESNKQGIAHKMSFESAFFVGHKFNEDTTLKKLQIPILLINDNPDDRQNYTIEIVSKEEIYPDITEVKVQADRFSIEEFGLLSGEYIVSLNLPDGGFRNLAQIRNSIQETSMCLITIDFLRRESSTDYVYGYKFSSQETRQVEFDCEATVMNEASLDNNSVDLLVILNYNLSVQATAQIDDLQSYGLVDSPFYASIVRNIRIELFDPYKQQSIDTQSVLDISPRIPSPDVVSRSQEHCKNGIQEFSYLKAKDSGQWNNLISCLESIRLSEPHFYIGLNLAATTQAPRAEYNVIILCDSRDLPNEILDWINSNDCAFIERTLGDHNGLKVLNEWELLTLKPVVCLMSCAHHSNGIVQNQLKFDNIGLEIRDELTMYQSDNGRVVEPSITSEYVNIAGIFLMSMMGLFAAGWLIVRYNLFNVAVGIWERRKQSK